MANACSGNNNKKWFTNKTILAVLVLVLVCTMSYIFPILKLFKDSLLMYVNKIWWALLLGFILGGIIDYFVPREYISHILARPNKRTILYAGLLGFLMSACSHGILALSIAIHKKGASNPAVVAFLLASPWANLPITLMLIAFFGLAKALYIIFSALIIAITTGLIYQVLESKGIIETNKNTAKLDKDFSIMVDFKKRASMYKLSANQLLIDAKGVYKGMVMLSNMVLWWILIGIGLASLIGSYVPQGVFHQYMGPTFLGMFATLALATIIEVC